MAMVAVGTKRTVASVRPTSVLVFFTERHAVGANGAPLGGRVGKRERRQNHHELLAPPTDHVWFVRKSRKYLLLPRPWAARRRRYKGAQGAQCNNG